MKTSNGLKLGFLFSIMVSGTNGNEGIEDRVPGIAEGMEIRADMSQPGMVTLDPALRPEGKLPGDADPAQHFNANSWRRAPSGRVYASGAIAYFADVRKIWDYRSSGTSHYYNAFTSLARFKGAWYVSFREGNSHATQTRFLNGRARVIRSENGNEWKSVALIEEDGDVRDPQLSVTPDGQLMINTALRLHSETDGYYFRSVTYLSEDGENWSGPYECPETGFDTWRWSVTWHNGIGYSVGYAGKDATGTLYTTTDGKTWKVHVKDFFYDGIGTEASLAFGSDDTAYCLVRRAPRVWDYRSLGIAKPPYKDWTWKKDVEMAGHKIISLSDGRLLAGGRLMGFGNPRTSLVWIDPYRPSPVTHISEVIAMTEDRKLRPATALSVGAREFLTFPSSRDNAYPGIVEHDEYIWFTYYSNEGKDKAKELGFEGDPKLSSIYLAKIKLAERASVSPLPEPDEMKATRFKDSGNGTVTDGLTGLVWAKAPADDMAWQDALKYCEDLRLAGHEDWRLPTVEELRSLFDWSLEQPALPEGHPFKNGPHPDNPGNSLAWAAQPFLNWDGTQTGYAWYVNMVNGSVYISNRLRAAWPVVHANE